MNILVVEDEAASRRALVHLLRGEGHEAIGVESVREALDACRNETFDVLVFDYALPDATGLDLLAQLDGSRPPPAALMVTAQTLGPRTRKAAARHGVSVLRKPVSTSELLSGIRLARRARLA